MNKVCCRCHNEKPIIYFCKNKLQKDGYHFYCKACKQKSAKQSYLKHRDSILEKSKKYYSNPEIKQRKLEYGKLWKLNNEEYVKSQAKIYNKTKSRKESRKRERLKHIERYTAYAKEYRKTDKYKCCDKNKRHKTRQIKKYTDITTVWLNKLFDKTIHCEICKCKMDNNGNKYPNGKHLDHITPLVVGGAHVKNNVRFICFKCNVSRPKDGSDILKLVI